MGCCHRSQPQSQHSQLTAETGIMHAADRLEHSPWHASGTRGHGFAVPVQVWAQVQTSKSTAEADINRATIE